uniref:Potassium transporter (Trk family) n=1 Tax=Solibacter usitatus (strain Ellin6076) TaxID=234267 RepID=Q024W9_SOLUE
MIDCPESTTVQTIVIGGGQAGLSVGFHLAKLGLPFQILDANERVGDAWRKRWDSLRVFHPARYVGLPGMRFPGRGDAFPTKDQMADYLVEYARRFRLPVRNGIKVNRLWKEADQFVIAAGDQVIRSENVVVAMANYQQPRVPAFAAELDPAIVQLHSHEYRNLSQLREGGVLVVGAGNSGAEIAIEAARSHPTWISGQESGHIPWQNDGFIGRFFLVRLLRFFYHHILTVKTPLGRKLRPKLIAATAPLIRVKPEGLTGCGVTRVPRMAGVRTGLPLLADGSTLDVKNVIWCTGYHRGFGWIELPIFQENGEPEHEEGTVRSVPGMYFVGLHFLYSMTSASLVGVGRDAERVAKAIASRARILKPGLTQR